MARPKIAGVYHIRNTVTGEVYIGSSVDIMGRLAHHRGYLTRGNHVNNRLQANWNEHGADAFDFGVTEHTAPTLDALMAAEERHQSEAHAAGVCLNPKWAGARYGRMHGNMRAAWLDRELTRLEEQR